MVCVPFEVHDGAKLTEAPYVDFINYAGLHTSACVAMQEGLLICNDFKGCDMGNGRYGIEIRGIFDNGGHFRRYIPEALIIKDVDEADKEYISGVPVYRSKKIKI